MSASRHVDDICHGQGPLSILGRYGLWSEVTVRTWADDAGIPRWRIARRKGVREDLVHRPFGRKARLAIGLYAPQFLGRGLGAESLRLVLRHAFGTLGMHRVDLRVLDFNDRAIAAYRACGFVEEGRERESCWVEGRWHDDVIMGVLDREFALADVEGG